MNIEAFREFPDDARVWIYAFPQDLDGSSLQIVDSALAEFSANWKSHDDEVQGGYAIYKDRFVILAFTSTCLIPNFDTKEDIPGQRSCSDQITKLGDQ